MPGCDAKIRPFPNPTEVKCDLLGDHDEHVGKLRDYAYTGSVTVIHWFDLDRRTFRGEWAPCPENCILPLGHRGNHAP